MTFPKKIFGVSVIRFALQKNCSRRYSSSFTRTPTKEFNAKKNVRCASTRKETERKTENQAERLVSKRCGKCVVNVGGRSGRMIFISITATSDDGRSQRRRRKSDGDEVLGR